MFYERCQLEFYNGFEEDKSGKCHDKYRQRGADNSQGIRNHPIFSNISTNTPSRIQQGTSTHLPNAIRIPPKPLRADGQIIRLILQAIETLLALGNLGDVFSHDVDRVVDLGLDMRSLARAAALLGTSAAGARDVWVVGFGPALSAHVGRDRVFAWEVVQWWRDRQVGVRAAGDVERGRWARARGRYAISKNPE